VSNRFGGALRGRSTGLAAALLALFPLADAADAQQAQSPAANPIEADGTVNVPSFKLPPSAYLSEEARKKLPRTPNDMNAPLRQLVASGQVGAVRARIGEFMAADIKHHTDAFPATMRKTTIAGVEAVYVTPPNIPAKNKGKILLNLPGGGFIMGAAPGTGMVESIPLASLAQVEIVSITYRQWPEHKFPAASEDVAKVYRELLKTHKPENIGIFGCSAGGFLTAEALAWFQKEKLPRPRAAGIFCASADAGMGGDSSNWARALGGLSGSEPPLNNYFSDEDRRNPLASPIRSPAILRQFPPTLIITSGRAMDLSGAINTDRELTKVGVESELHVWDGLGHAFFYDIDLPESREAYHVMARFFGRHMGLQIRP
jgi:acetyl esterase/lipase